MKIQLKNRPTPGVTLQIGLDFARECVAKNDASAVLELFESALENPGTLRHDTYWLGRIIDWQKDPRTPTPLKKQAPWLSMAAKVNELDATRKYLDITPDEFYVLKQRLFDDSFAFVAPNGLPEPLSAYVDFYQDLVKQIEDLQAKLEKAGE